MSEATVGPEPSGQTSRKAEVVSEATVVAPSSPRLRRVGGALAEGGGDSTAPPAADEASSGAGQGVGDSEQQEQESAAVAKRDREDDLLSFFAVAIALAIIAILIRKCYRFVA